MATKTLRCSPNILENRLNKGLMVSRKHSQKPTRAPVVAILGHVDHGKTTLLDAIRQSNVVAQEHGGITQHIGAYQVTLPLPSDQGEMSKITFIDTPGHAAFTKMRARGAKATDVAVLVVAANDGVMPQTVEAIDHIRAAEVPLVVAVNKIDLAEADPAKVYQQLAKHGVRVESYGGRVPAVEISATQKKGLKELLEMILLVAGLQELQGDPSGVFSGVVVESGVDIKRGRVATILVRDGTIRLGERIYVGRVSAKIRALIKADGQRAESVGPSVPVEVLGFEQIPEVGGLVSKEVPAPEKPTTQIIKRPLPGAREDKFGIVLRTDVEGTQEAIIDVLTKSQKEGIQITILTAGTGEITESDIFLAKASGAMVIGFNVHLPPTVAKLAETEEVVVKIYQVIYELTEEIEAAVKGQDGPKTKTLGRGEVLKVFQGTEAPIAGVKVSEGKLSVGDKVRIWRGEKTIAQTKMATMKQAKKNVKSTGVGSDCGITFSETVAFRPGDIVESYREIKKDGGSIRDSATF